MTHCFVEFIHVHNILFMRRFDVLNLDQTTGADVIQLTTSYITTIMYSWWKQKRT